MNKRFRFFIYFFVFGFFGLMIAAGSRIESPQIQLKRDDKSGNLRVFIDGEEKLVYQYHSSLDLVHYWPLKSPSGKNMLVQKTEPYPHHRAFWFADTVQLQGQKEASFYNALYSGQKTGKDSYKPPFRHHIRHIKFTCLKTKGDRAVIEKELLWEMEDQIPVLDEQRCLIIQDLGEGEYFLDIQFELTASYGDVRFLSDEVHYAWPYLRMNPCFCGDNGGVITSSSGSRGQENTNMKYALWVDYSNTVEGVTEGLAVLQWPDGRKHRWLTREYGTFGPRRPDGESGKEFTLEKDQSITQRVGILVHKGDVRAGKVREQYRKYIQKKN
jgi:hypothetical protein